MLVWNGRGDEKHGKVISIGLDWIALLPTFHKTTEGSKPEPKTLLHTNQQTGVK